MKSQGKAIAMILGALMLFAVPVTGFAWGLEAEDPGLMALSLGLFAVMWIAVAVGLMCWSAAQP